MATMIARGNAALSASSSPSVSAHEKGCRNKRKFRADPPLIDLNAPAPPLENELPDYDFFPVEKTTQVSSFEHHHASSCDMCKVVSDGPRLGPEPDEFQDADWSDFTEAQLEEMLLSNLDMAFRSAIKMVTSYGYSEQVAANAVLSSGHRYGCKETVMNIVDNALDFLKSAKEVDSSPRENLEEDLKKLEKSVLSDMINVLREVRPFFNLGDAMWWLLMSDANVSHACAMDSSSMNSLGNDEPAGGFSASHLETYSNSNHVSYPVISEPGVPQPDNMSSFAPYPRSTPEPEMSQVVGIPSLACERFMASNIDGSASKCTLAKEYSISSFSNVQESSSSTVSRSVHEEKPTSNRNTHLGSSKRDSILRQKSIHFEKSYRALGSKAVLRACKNSGLGSLMLDRKCRASFECTSISLKASSFELGKAAGIDKSMADASLNLSFSSGQPSSSSCSTKKVSTHSPTPVADTELSLSLPSTNNTGVIPSQDSNSEVTNSSGIYFDKICKDWIPEDKKDEMLLLLVPLMRELQAQMQDWTDWAQQKIMQAARRLSKDKAELQTLRQEKDEVARLQRERQALEDNTKKKLAEMEGAIAKASSQVERANAAARRLELENAQLRVGMEAAKLHAAESAANCQEVSRRELNTLKMYQSWDRQKALLQDEFANVKRHVCQLQQQIEQAVELQDQSEARRSQDEKLKDEILAKATSERKEREQVETSVKSQENALKLKAETDMQRCKNDVRRLEQQIAQLKLVTDMSNIAVPRWGPDKSYASLLSDGKKSVDPNFLAKFISSLELNTEEVQRERECVMCLCEEMSVVFLPCAHQVVCRKCNELHEKQGMKECPSCRTPIQRRISVRSADSLRAYAF